MESKKVTGLSVLDKVIMVSIRRLPYQSNITAELFIQLAKNEVNVDVINQNPGVAQTMNLAFTASADDLDVVSEVLDEFQKKYPKAEIMKIQDVVKISLIGSAMRTQSGIAAEAFEVLANNNLEFKLITTSEISISYTFDKKYKEQAVSVLAQHFNL